MVGGGAMAREWDAHLDDIRTSNALFTQDIILAELIGIFMDKSQETKDRLAAARILTAPRPDATATWRGRSTASSTPSRARKPAPPARALGW